MMVANRCNRKISARFRGRCFPWGFSLVELMVVIAIMLLLAAMALPRLLDAQMRAYEMAAVSFLRTLQSSQETYRLAHGFYSDNFTDLGLSARGPAVPGDSIAPDEESRLATLFPGIAPFRVYAAESVQQPPPKNPPPPPGDQGFGGTPPPKKGRPAEGAPGGPSGGGTGSGGSGPPGKSGSSGPGSGGPQKGAGSGSSSGGTPSGGATGGGVPSTPGAPQTGGGQGGSFSPSPAAASKTNVVLKHNYIFTLTRPTLTTWVCTVAPVRDRGNSKFFYIDQTGIIRVERGKFASNTSPQM